MPGTLPGTPEDDKGEDRTTDAHVGRLLDGEYEILSRIAEGGMGRIYRAHQRGLGRDVAVKFLHPDLGADDEVVQRFYREMQATARIEHPNTTRIYAYGHHEGDLFLVMELLSGRTLAELLEAEGPLPAIRAVRIGAQIARALAAAHARGVVHRDLKPENVLLTSEYGPPDWVKVLDFGLARLEDAPGADLTAVGARVGTPLYMAPETVEHRKADPRSDLYALGVLLYEMLVGRPPFQGAPRAVMHDHLNAVRPRPSEAVRCPEWLDRLVPSLMAREPAKRPRDAARVARVLERGAEREVVLKTAPVVRRGPPWGILVGAAVLLALLAPVLLGIGLLLGWLLSG